MTAYGLPVNQVLGPQWIEADRFDITAKVPPGATKEQVNVMLQNLLADRFKLVMRTETKEVPVYAVTVAKGGPKLQKAAVEEKDCAENPTSSNDPKWCHGFDGGQGRGLHGPAVSMSDLADAAENFADRPVVDKTGIEGLFNIQTEGWVPMRPRPPRPPGQEPTAEDLAFADPARPTLFQIFDRLGRKMESTKAPIEVCVVERIEKPSEN